MQSCLAISCIPIYIDYVDIHLQRSPETILQRLRQARRLAACVKALLRTKAKSQSGDPTAGQNFLHLKAQTPLHDEVTGYARFMTFILQPGDRA